MKSAIIAGIAMLCVETIPASGQELLPDQSTQQCDWLKAHALHRTDLPKLVDSLRISQGPKGEYETTKAYESRKKQLNGPFLDDEKHAQLVQQIERSSGRYDADAGTLSYDLHSFWFVDESTKDGVPYREFRSVPQIDHSSSYIGQNGFGATMPVTSVDQTIYTFQYALSKKKSVSELNNGPPLVTIHISPEKARQARPFLLIYFAGEVTGFSTATSVTEASFNVPREASTRWNYINVTHPCGMIRNSLTNEVLAVFQWPSD